MNDNGKMHDGALGGFGAGDGASDMEFRIWAYIDGLSEEALVIERLIAEQAAWRAKYAELLDVHHLMQEAELEEPSLRFTKNVMEEIARLQVAPAAKEYINKRIIWGIAAFFISVIAGFLVYGFSQVNWRSGSSQTSPVGIDFAAVDYSGMFNNTLVNGFLMVNVILGLLLLDRYLSMKRRQYMQGFDQP